MRKTRRGKLKRQKAVIVIGSFCMLFVFSVGYAAFSTTIRLNAKGNVKSNRLILNPNGGILDVTSKRVTKGKAYGELPTPTREGYIFKGWNGKNKFDEDAILGNIGTYENGYYVFTFNSAHINYGSDKHIPIEGIKENTQYTITITGYVDECAENTCTPGNYGRLQIVPKYSDNSQEFFPLNETSETKKIYTTATNKSVLFFNMTYGTGGVTKAHIKNIQLEEGNESTDYEPYYITSDTIVTQEGEHTLTAIWEEEPTEE